MFILLQLPRLWGMEQTGGHITKKKKGVEQK